MSRRHVQAAAIVVVVLAAGIALTAALWYLYASLQGLLALLSLFAVGGVA